MQAAKKKIYFGEILGQVPGAPVATGYFPQHGMRGLSSFVVESADTVVLDKILAQLGCKVL